MHYAALLLGSMLLSGTPTESTGNITLDLGTARLVLDAQGGVDSLTFADGTVWPGGGQPACILETEQETVSAQSVSRDGDVLRVVFAGGAQADFQIHTEAGLAVLRLVRLSSAQPVRRFQLFGLPVPVETERIGTLNAAQTERHFVAVMPAEPNVDLAQEQVGTVRGDRKGCQHEFVQADTDVKHGRFAAHFTATCDDQPSGWSVRGNQLPRPLDLTGCQAIRAWVHGDGQGEALKIQLGDGQDGYRDNYLTIDFEGWRQVTLTDAPFNTLKYNHVTSLSFYYNGLPAGKTVTCRIDQVEAILQREGREEVVLLEDFESPRSPLWSGPSVTLKVQTHAKYGIEPAAFGLIACPRSESMETIRRFEEAANLPSPRPGGEWNKRSPWIQQSYFFLTGFKESQFDEAIAIARRGGFQAILIDQGSWSLGTGHYDINRDNFPEGLPGLQRTVKRFHDAGFRVGLHFLGPSIYPPDAYLTPVPDPRLVKDALATLSADVDETANVIPTTAVPTVAVALALENFPAEDGGYMGKGTVLQIGNELIAYGRRSSTPPFSFTECQRGHLGTKAAPHKAGEPVAHLARSYGYHMFDMDTTLLDEVAKNFTRVANACQIDMIYFDGSESLQGDHWYYNARLHKAFYDQLDNKNMLLQASSYSPYSWHLLARSASADGHGDLKGYLDERSPWFDSFARGGMPLDIGWYYGYDSSATSDMYEYVLGATIGYDASMSYQVSVDAAAKHPFTGEILDLIARYEQLRLSGRVSDAMRARLRIDPTLGGTLEPAERLQRLAHRREYRLVGAPGSEIFQRVVYDEWHAIDTPDPALCSWSFRVAEGPAQLGAQIQATGGPWLRPGPAYASPQAWLLESFEDLAPYTRNPAQQSAVRAIGPGEAGSVLPGVTQRVELAEAEAPVPGRYAVYTAESTLAGDSGWSVISRSFTPPLDLSWHRGIGFWLRGDGRGGLFKLQLCDDRGAMDYYIPNDFTDWRYQQLVRPERDAIDYSRVQSLLLYYNGLPGNSTVACGIDDVKALRSLDTRELVDPYVEVAGTRCTWKGRLAEGQYVTFWPGEPVRRNGLPLEQPEIGPVVAAGPALPPGEYTARFGSAGDPAMPLRVRVTLQSSERHPVP
ncbi:MAG: CIA30 family protein [Pirellulaceae bacterium]